MKNKIIYDGRTFTVTDIKSGGIHLAASLPSMQLEANTFTAIVKSDDPTLTQFTRNAPLEYYHKDRLICITYVQTVDRVGPNKYKFYGTSAIGRLIEQQHAGGIYTGQTVEEVITDICGPVPVIIKSSLKGIKLYGWLPYASPPKRSARDNLVQVLFAVGAAVRTDLDGVLRIQGLWDGVSGSAGKDKMYTGPSVDYDGAVTQVIVTEHQYTPGSEEKQLFDGTAQSGDVVTFDEPMHSLTATGFSIQASGANWARVSAGTGTLTGKVYVHNTRQVSRDVQQAEAPNVKTVEDATLVSLVNSGAAAKRLADYYKCRERVDAAVVHGGEIPGDRLATYHPFDKVGVAACLESADITISGTLKAQEKLLVGYVPQDLSDIEYFDKTEIITHDGSWTVPNGVTRLRYVLIGGGDGGRQGETGKRGENGGNGSTISARGNGGDGGDPGAPGAGGKILQGEIDVTPGESFQILIGAGGESDSAGGNTAFGSFSSESGASSPSGFTELTTGTIYAVPGSSGISGGAGSGKTEGPNIIYNGVTYTPGYNGSGLGPDSDGTIVLGGAGGGAAAGTNGGNGGSGLIYSTQAYGGSGGKGASAAAGKNGTIPGQGGGGGNGGGGGGGGGPAAGSDKLVFTGSGGAGGAGGAGGRGASGLVILYYTESKKNPSGQLVDKNNMMVLDRLGRRIIV